MSTVSSGSQANRILAHLKAGKTITPLMALRKFGCLRLGARIYDLRAKGHNIVREIVDIGDGRAVAEYRLIVRPAE